MSKYKQLLLAHQQLNEYFSTLFLIIKVNLKLELLLLIQYDKLQNHI